jgi:anti-sigma regulatory factor (Ser/Thr protein kinase)
MSPAEMLPPVTPRDAVLDSVAVCLPIGASAAGGARSVVKKRFGDVLATETLDDALLVVSELVTNAVRHGAGAIELRIDFDGHRVTGDVSDEGLRFTQSVGNTHRPDEIGGHGLDLVARIANSWGLGEESSCVWFEILAPGGP